MVKSDPLREALAKIAEVANSVVQSEPESEDFPPEPKTGRGSSSASLKSMPGCVVKSLPQRLHVKAAATATGINPVNAPALGAMAVIGDGGQVLSPLAIAEVTTRYWGPIPRRLTVSFMETTPDDLKTEILRHMNAWTKTSCISFALTNGTGHVRISREPGGYWSYLGTDILHIPKNRQTMNLEGFTIDTDEREYRRVVRHETGHTLGFPHEHMRKKLVARIDREKAYVWFWEHCRWPKKVVDEQVLTPLDETSLIGTSPDQTSIMCYQLPGEITTDGQPIPGGLDINATDYAFAGKIYPKPGHMEGALEEDWAESEDVEVTV